MTDHDQRDEAVANSLQNWNSGVIEEFRANKGRVGGGFEGAPVLLLHTIGAKSALERVNPMMYLEQDSRIYVFASKAGADSHPDWYHNLQANPRVTVEISDTTIDADAVPLHGAERERIYTIQSQRYPGFAEYEAMTSRVIPVIELVRSSSTAGNRPASA